MPSFQCQVCHKSFELAQSVLDKYPGWSPKYCREHSPTKKGGAGGASKSGGAHSKASSGSAGRRPKSSGTREENLTRAQVLEKYHAGPDHGVFTDGSAVPNPGPGGWGLVWVRDGEIVEERYGGDPQTTNNRMELKALIEALRLLPETEEVTVYTDSRLCVDTITKWAPGWKQRGWKRKGGEIKNLELVQELYDLHLARPKATLSWIAAHSGYRWNEYADCLATAWMRPEA